jgi:hypothetical protein
MGLWNESDAARADAHGNGLCELKCKGLAVPHDGHSRRGLDEEVRVRRRADGEQRRIRCGGHGSGAKKDDAEGRT